MKRRIFAIGYWILLISIAVLAYIDDRDVVHNKSMAVPMVVLFILLCCCRLLDCVDARNKL